MKRRLLKLIFIIILIIISSKYICFAESSNEQETIQKQQSEFGISEFIKNSKQYTGEFFEDIDLNEILDDAIKGKVDNSTLLKRFLNLLGDEFSQNLKAIVSILVIVIIHSILKSVSESLENEEVSKIIYYVQYILIVTIIMASFSDIVTLVRDTTTNLIGFMNMLVPLLITLMLYTGSIATSGLLEPIILFIINFVGNLIQNIIIPLVLIFTSLIIISKISNKIQVDKLAKFLKSGIVWFLGIVLTIFVAVVSLEGTLSSSVDGITSKTAKTIVSSAVPVVGKILGDAVDTVLGCGLILKNAVGIVGVIIVIGICVMPIIKLSILTILYKLVSAVISPISEENIVSLLEQIGDVFKLFLAILCSISFLIIIGTALVIKISNSGMMYR